jgi:hypothetical protein
MRSWEGVMNEGSKRADFFPRELEGFRSIINQRQTISKSRGKKKRKKKGGAEQLPSWTPETSESRTSLCSPKNRE